MSVKHLILGWTKRHPTHGYSIKKCYENFINPSDKLNYATLYPLLSEMEDEGLVKRAVEGGNAGRSRKVVSITDKGAEVFNEWLRSDSDEELMEDFRYQFFQAFPFLVKYSFFHELGDEDVLEKVRRQLDGRRRRLADYRGARESMIAKGLEECKIEIIDYGIMHEQTTVRWLERMEAKYAGGAEGAKTKAKPHAKAKRKPADAAAARGGSRK